ncbi:ALPHA/BETA-HYDROLASES SUPERFAMILY PROTEIN [Salix purpurea]|uniref:ALPHA/BETA-HYDROLASES SUPERFAMILY PROTEIN n=1 Tax=Salix purpurea TaxID=77065 RepID=A0A9Q0US87_SALPP|nr:ALPHA/BETA-HYDROLASES SUPERFAMILY PROTEIN [Salix purpurea]
MSLCCGVECVVIIGFARWVWKRCAHISGHDSANWTLVAPGEFEPIPRMCRLVLAVYETDLHNPQFSPQHGYRLNPDWVIKRVTYEQTHGRAPPYLIYTDHEHKEIVLAVRGLNLYKESDYKTLLDNRLGMQMFDGGFVHHGLLKSAVWLLNAEGETLKRLWEESGKEYGMVFAGHSLGSGVVSLLTVIVANHRDKLGGVPREKIRCYAMAPARCMSLNLAVKYADVIHSVILQDDFLPRTATPLEDVFKSIFCLPCLLLLVCLRDTFIPEGRKLRDSRRFYAPGRMYHIVERRFCRCGRFPPEVRTAIPVDGRFEHIVLSCNATSDHGIVWIERESEKALQKMKEIDSGTITTPPKIQKLERMRTIEQELKDALERAVSLNFPHAVTTPDVEPLKDNGTEPSLSEGDQASQTESTSTGRKTNWDEVVKKLFRKSESGNLVLNKEVSAPNHNISIDQPS